MAELVDRFIAWVNHPDLAGLWAAFAILLPIATAAFAIVKVLPKAFGKIWQALTGLFQRWRTRGQLPRMLHRYREQLERSTLGFRHAWMPDDKTIEAFLVPVVAYSADDSQLDVFNHFSGRFLDKDARLTVFTGAAGSGKSVALAVVIRAAWESTEGSESGDIGRMASYVPVLLSFDDLVTHAANEPTSQTLSVDPKNASKDLQAQSAAGRRIISALLKSLERMLFANGHPRAQAVREQFLSKLIAERRLLIVVDELDEVSRPHRHRVLQELLAFVGTTHFCILGCREEVYPEHQQLLESQAVQRLRLSGFTQATSERFLRRWAMVTGLSTEHVLDYLADRRTLRKIVENPLLLTIACFLGARDQPTELRRATDFYRECTDALLVSWRKNAREHGLAVERHAYERPVLRQLARWWLSASDNVGGLAKDRLYPKFRGWLQQELGTPPPAGMEVAVLENLLIHCGLLIAVDGVRVDFIHRTFLEYLAADYYATVPSGAAELMSLFKSDPVHFERAALFYCSLARDRNTAHRLIEDALERGDVRFAIAVIADSPGVSGALCHATMLAVEKEIAHPSPELIESLGELARSSMQPFAAQAEAHLRRLVEHRHSHSQSVLEFSLRELVTDTPEGLALLHECAESVRLPFVISGLSSKTIASIGREMLADLTHPQRIRDWIECLRSAERLGELCTAFVQVKDSSLRGEAALALVSLSASEGFWHALDRTERTHAPAVANDSFDEWGWPHNVPKTEHGKRMAVDVARSVANTMTSNGQFPFDPLTVRSHRWMYFLTHALAWESCYRQSRAFGPPPKEVVKMPVVGVMFRSLPRLVRQAWASHVKVGSRRRLRLDTILASILSLTPAILLGFAVRDLSYMVGASNQFKLGSIAALTGLLLADALAWLVVARDSRPRYDARTPLDVVLATILGPACVLRELPDDVRFKRRDDFIVMIFTAVFVSNMLIVAWLSWDVVYSTLALLVALDTVIQANARVGATTTFSLQFDVMVDFLIKAKRSDAL